LKTPYFTVTYFFGNYQAWAVVWERRHPGGAPWLNSYGQTLFVIRSHVDLPVEPLYTGYENTGKFQSKSLAIR